MPNREMEGLHGEFHYHPVLQVEESAKQGRPVYKDELYIRIQIKGQKNQIRARKATEIDREEYPAAWRQFTDSAQDVVNGTPLTALPGIGPAMVLELKQLGITSVEDMANLTDSAMDKFRGGYMFRQRAQAYLSAMNVVPEKPMTILSNDDGPIDEEMMRRDPTVIAKRRGRPPKDRTLQ